jgi:hypothetical protein
MRLKRRNVGKEERVEMWNEGRPATMEERGALMKIWRSKFCGRRKILLVRLWVPGGGASKCENLAIFGLEWLSGRAIPPFPEFPRFSLVGHVRSAVQIILGSKLP